MPFTPSHILAIVPIGHLGRRQFAFSALVIGSLVPDWPLFIPVGPTYRFTHSFLGLPITCIPIGLGSYLFFQMILKRPMFELLPPVLRARSLHLAAPFLPVRVQQWLGLIAAIACGAFTHIVWDAFTHEGKWGTQLIPSLNRAVLDVGNQSLPGYKVLQYGSSAIGLLILPMCLLMWVRTRPSQAVPPSLLSSITRHVIITAMVFVPSVAGLLPIAQLIASPISYEGVTEAVVSGVILAGGVLLLLLGLYSLLFYPLVRMQKRLLS